MATTKNNLDLWNKVEATDPDHTKKVSLGRSFTAIDPYWQVKNATEQFGPAGEGWGWHVERVEYLPTNEIAILVRLWHGHKDQFIEQWGQSGLYIDRAESKKDEDCFKKATTDGITKCLSYLGFNADVFLGKFDDNKYVEQQRQASEKRKSEANEQENAHRLEQLGAAADVWRKAIPTYDSAEKCEEVRPQIRQFLVSLDRSNRDELAIYDEIVALFKTKMDSFGDKKEAA